MAHATAVLHEPDRLAAARARASPSVGPAAATTLLEAQVSSLEVARSQHQRPAARAAIEAAQGCDDALAGAEVLVGHAGDRMSGRRALRQSEPRFSEPRQESPREEVRVARPTRRDVV